jgi:hypothetical protein
MADFAGALEQTAALLGGDPWLERTPWLVREVVPILQGGEWRLGDAAGATAALAPGFGPRWELLALCGGHPATMLLEWDGCTLRPLSVWAERRLTLLGGLEP